MKLYCLKDNFYSYLTRHSLEFLLKNSGSSGTFQLSQKSPDGVRGHIINPSVILHSGQFVTVKVDEIKIPTYRQDNIFSLMVKKKDPTYEEREHSVPGYKQSTSCSVILNLVEGTYKEESYSPVGNVWVSQSNCDHLQFCGEAYWLAEFRGQDLNSGMFRVKINSFQSHDLFWWHSGFTVNPFN